MLCEPILLKPARRLSCASQQEFQAEQDYMKTLSYLSPEEQQKYKERQSVSWLYQKPPGMDAADKPKVRHLWCTPHFTVKVRVHVEKNAQRLTQCIVFAGRGGR